MNEETNVEATAEELLRSLGNMWLRCTLVQAGDPVRFERTIHRIVERDRLPPGYESCIGVKFANPVESRFGLWKNKTMFFDPERREWIGHAETRDAAPRLQVEIPGLFHNHTEYFRSTSWVPGTTWRDQPIDQALLQRYDRREHMHRLGIAISGNNIRAILFKKICCGAWSGAKYDRASIWTVKGQALLTLMRNIVETGACALTPDEEDVFRMYFQQDALLNGA